MRERSLSVRQIELIAGTRVALGVGLGLLLAGKLTDQQRRRAGWALFLAGVGVTPPLIASVFGKRLLWGKNWFGFGMKSRMNPV